ncbi:CCDC90 family protein [Herbaspirillum sp. alder98]|uniref:CCDC90 family protein n=1 Tax=Herbaspirillum sp. alder98 TaxID=2913096 RepID=UPI001CD863D1|nr:CCDC90 family protein [Herbaspirillum sp. alder98]MCA1323762.1 CCDC90 family protein [Herbaspirillum sp. alder98]
MATTFFDTHAYVKQLEASGVSTEQAEAHATALAQAMNNELVKKADLNEFRSEVNTRFTEAAGRIELLKWMIGFVLATNVAVLFKIFH